MRALDGVPVSSKPQLERLLRATDLTHRLQPRVLSVVRFDDDDEYYDEDGGGGADSGLVLFERPVGAYAPSRGTRRRASSVGSEGGSLWDEYDASRRLSWMGRFVATTPACVTNSQSLT